MCTPHHCHKHWLSTSLFHRLIFKIFQNCKLQTTIQWAKLLWEHNNTSSSGSGSRSNSNKTDDKLSYAPKQTSVTQLFYATFNCVILLLLLLGLFKVLLCTEVEWLPVTATKKLNCVVVQHLIVRQFLICAPIPGPLFVYFHSFHNPMANVVSILTF